MVAREMNPTELQLRLVFNNGVLSETQEANGLKRSWVLLKPHFQTICDVVSYILDSFNLHDSSPHGIILFRDDFVLPEFESISILKDNDLISVKRKETRLLNASKAVQEATAYIKDGVVEKLPLPSGVKLLANEEFDKQTGGHQSESEKDEDEGVEIRSPAQNDPNGDLASKKRKSFSKLENAKKKRKVQTISRTVQKKHAHESEHITKPKKKKKRESRSNQNALCSPVDMEKFASDLVPESKSERSLSPCLFTKKVNKATLRQKKKRVLNRSEQDEAKKDELCDRQQPVKDMTIDTGPKEKIVANIIPHHGEDSHSQQVEIVKDSEENQGANAFDVNPTENGTWEDHSGAKNVSDNQIVKSSHRATGGHQSESEKDEDEGVEIRSPVQNDPNGDLASKKGKSSSKLESAKKKRKVQTISCTVQKKHITKPKKKSEHITKPKKKRKHKSRSYQNALCSPEDMEKFASDLVPESKSESELNESKEDNNQASAMPDKTKKVEHHLSDILLQLSNLTRQVNRATLRQKKKRVLNRSEQDEAKEDELCDRQQPVKDLTIDTGPKKKIVANIIPHHDEDSHSQQVEIVKDSEENQGSNTFDVNPNENDTWEDHPGAKNVSDDQIVKEDVWEKVIEAVSAKKARLMPEDNWNKKETGAKWPSSCYNEVQDDAEKVASKLSSQKLPTPGLANSKRDAWEEITEVASAKKAQAQLMLEGNWNKKETGAKWPSSSYNQVQDDAKKVASELSNQNPPTPGLANGKRDLWEEMSEAASAKKAQLLLEDNWNKKDTGAKWPASLYNKVQDDTKKVATELSNQKPPTPGLGMARLQSISSTLPSNGEKDVWEEITEAASAKKAQLMQENNWKKKETGAKWPSSRCNEVQDDAKKVASDPNIQKPPTPGLANGEKDVWEEITEAASAKKAQPMQENNWKKKETGAKWPSSSYNQVQDDAKKVASKLSNQKPPTPGLANGEKDVWEEITEAASAKKAQLMQENNWKKKETGAKWPFSRYNEVQDDAKKVASDPNIQKPPTPGLANGEKDVWEEITKAASAKKAQLMQENNWKNKETGAKWPPSWYNEVQDDAKKVASDPSIQKPPTPGLANCEKDVLEELTKATSAKKAQLVQEDRWNKEETAAAMVLQQLKECHWPKAVNEQSQLAKPSESARSIRAQARAQARALAHQNQSRCPAKQGLDRKSPLIEPTVAGLRTHKAENGVGQLDIRDFNGSRVFRDMKVWP
ncbi:uncharacterized protein LOC141598591 isoform X2 [Silene latifolia]|uniref:uncharacterized protein LOC141598591 isoform X2 n=1 Tax=Silene latifolia TaxID=37657 RepID=UPI003D782668